MRRVEEEEALWTGGIEGKTGITMPLEGDISADYRGL